MFPFEEGLVVYALMSYCTLMNSDNKKALIIDGGANMGYFSLLATSCGCDAIAYEPNA